MRVGFDVFISGDRVRFQIFPSNHHDATRPSFVTFAQDRHSNIAVAVLGHLNYQADLLARLPQSALSNDASVAAIVLALYQQLGKPGLEHLEGEFVLVVWEGAQRLALAMRDPLGCWPLYWYRAGEEIVISTSLQPIVKSQPKTTLNLDFLAHYLMWPSPGMEYPSEQTPFAQVQRVLPGTIVSLGAQQVTQQRWWDWTAHQQRQEKLTLADASEQYADLLRQAVQQRMQRGKIAAHLSGGMDSSSVVCLARDWLMTEGSSAQLETLTAVFQRPGLVRERSYAELVVAQGGPIRAHFIPADQAVNFSWFDEGLPYHDEPFGGLGHLAMERVLVETAEQLGADTILTGMGADELLVGTHLGLATLFRQGQWLTALKAASRMAKANNQSIWLILQQFGLGPAYPLLMFDGIQTWFRQGVGQWPKLSPFSIPPWVNASFARQYQMRQIGQNNAQQIYGHTPELSFDRWSIQASIGDWTGWYLAAPRGMHHSHPFMDSRVFSFCLQLPTAVKEVPGMFKPVLQTAMQGTLPEPIRTRRDKACFNDLYGLGISRHLSQLEAMVRHSSIRDLEIIDTQQVIQLLRQVAVGIGDLVATSRLDTTIALIAWFDQMTDTWPHLQETPAAVYQFDAQLAIR